MPAVFRQTATIAAIASLLLATAARGAEKPPAAQPANPPAAKPGELQSPTQRGQVHVFGLSFPVNSGLVSRKMDQSPDFAVCLAAQPANAAIPLDVLWEKLAQREAGPAYAAARQMIERGDESATFLAARLAGGAMLSRRVPYENPRDLQIHRAAYVLECIGTAAAQKAPRKITYAPVAATKLYLDKRRLDALGDLIPSGAVFRWGTERFAVDEMHQGQFAISNDGKLAATGPGSRNFRVAVQVAGGAVVPVNNGASSIQIWNTTTGRVTWEVPCGIDARYPSPMIFTPDGKHLLYQRNGQIIVTVAATGPIVQQWPTHLEPLTAMAISADGATLYTGHSDGSMNIFKFPSGEKLGGKQIPARSSPAFKPALQKWWRSTISTARHSIRACGNVKKRDWAAKRPKVESGASVTISPDAKTYAVVKMGSPIELRNLANDEVVKKLDWTPRRTIRPRVGRGGTRSAGSTVEFLDSQHLLLNIWPEPAQVLALATGKIVWRSETASNNAAPVAVSANGRFLIGTQRNQLQIIDLTDGSDLIRACTVKAEDPHLVMSEDGGTTLALREGRVCQFDPFTLEPLGRSR